MTDSTADDGYDPAGYKPDRHEPDRHEPDRHEPDRHEPDRHEPPEDDLPGDPACLLRRVCPRCGAVADSDPPTTCPQCHADLPGD